MKRGVKFFLLLGFACLGVGLIGAAVSFKAVDWSAGVTNIDIEKKIPAANIDTLIIQNDISGVTFIPSNSDEIKVHLVGTVGELTAKSCTIEAATEGSNVWRVDVCTQKKPQINIGFDLTELKALINNQRFRLRTEVTLPEKMYKAITVSSDTGGINFKEVKADKLTASTDTGGITIERYEGKQLSLQTDTGHINVENGQGDVKLKTDTGSITAKLHDIGDSVSLETDTGTIRLQLDPAPKNASFDLNTDTGSVNLEVPGVNVQRTDHHSAKGTIGDGSKKVTVRADTGFISVTGR
ncbi:DUF4097 family beta strand repeat protein [Paenibacillus sp. LMG 31458]|uniref:DUF4097 family beta strand repeat protein n=1 Tax=Paenibacillus phytorum TaxID=2654977 RepID=A0ABX1XQ20_9BACL|nr:DUF4097 family beta strand repeat-containing protein [Paenibacillus phytorum]NOU69980.1 DUF4097 family beta strand repeat protein [Paenibacillus phytorum]